MCIYIKKIIMSHKYNIKINLKVILRETPQAYHQRYVITLIAKDLAPIDFLQVKDIILKGKYF